MATAFHFDTDGFKFGTSKAKKIAVPVSRYGKYDAILTVKKPITERVAVQLAELYLSSPITKAHFERVKDDLFDDDLEWETLKEKGYETMGDLLTDAIFLEGIYVDKDGVMHFEMGS